MVRFNHYIQNGYVTFLKYPLPPEPEDGWGDEGLRGCVLLMNILFYEAPVRRVVPMRNLARERYIVSFTMGGPPGSDTLHDGVYS